MSVAVSDIRSSFRRRYPFGTLSSNEFFGWLEDALRFYNRYNPNVIREQIEVEAGDQRVELPEDCILVREVLYVQSLSGGTMTMSSLTSRGAVEAYNPSELLINQINAATGRRHAWEMWHQEGAYLVFESAFASAETLELTYTTSHVLNEDETAYETIPAEDGTLLANLVLAEIYESEGAAHAVTPDYVEGIGQVRHHFIPANAIEMVRRYRREVINKYRGVPGVIA